MAFCVAVHTQHIAFFNFNSGELVDVGGEYRVSRADYNDFLERRKTNKRKK